MGSDSFCLIILYGWRITKFQGQHQALNYTQINLQRATEVG